MILRLFQARVSPASEEAFVEYVRATALEASLRMRGLRAFIPGLRRDSVATTLAFASTWDSFENLTASPLGLNSPIVMPHVDSMIEAGNAKHFELVFGEVRALPLRDGVLSIARIPISSRYESAYFAGIRNAVDELLDTSGLVAIKVGRAIRGGTLEATVVSIWENRTGVVSLSGPAGMAAQLLEPVARYQAGEVETEEFEVLTAIHPEQSAPAVLVTDDEGRYVHATPAAETLTGRSLARLLTMRVQDLAADEVKASVPDLWRQFVTTGSQMGTFQIARPDGTKTNLRYHAKRDRPWPGTHASILAPVDEPVELDVEEALVRSGLVARYAVHA